MSDEKKSESIEERYEKAKNYLKRYSHSSRKLYQAILKALPPLKVNDQYDSESIDLTIKAGKIMDLLGEASRTWNVAIHWLYTVCNPKIKKRSNPKYSPVYEEHATQLPLNRFGELDHMVTDEQGNLIRAGDKLVGDDRFVGKGCEDYGSAWDDNGNVIKRDNNNHPVLDGFTKWIAQKLNHLQEICCRNPKRDRHFAAFLSNHTRDDEENKRNGEVEHKEAHSHLVIDMPTRRTRYRMMELLGYNFDDLTKTFKWIDQIDDQRKERIEAFLGTLSGAMQNYVVTKHYVSSLQYLIHQSSKAKRDQKTPYAVDEVISWLPDDPGKSYSSIAGVYDDEQVAEGVNAEIIRILHTPYNTAHHTGRLVGYVPGDKPFTYHQLAKLHSLGSKGTGHMNFSKRSKKLILDQLMEWIYLGEMDVTDWHDALHGAFDDGDAASLIADKDFIQRLDAVLDDEREATIGDISADRNMLTIFVSSSQGGIGKTYLATRLCQYLEKGRTPYVTAAEDKNKTVDYWQDYNDEKSAVIDEISPSSVAWEALKDLLDPHKIPRISSRFHNVSPWNVNLMMMTNVYSNGVSGYISDVLHYAPGVGKLGYLSKEGIDKWKLKENDPEAGQIYVSQLSQIVRRLPVNVHLVPTDRGTGTEVIVSVINFKPGSKAIRKYGYAYTRESDHVFNALINEDTSEQEMDYIVKTVVKMIKQIRGKAKAVFERDPNATLGPENGFMTFPASLGVYLKDGKPYLTEDKNRSDATSSYSTVTNRSNVLTKLSNLKFELWPEVNVDKTSFRPKLDQLTALMRGYTVPVRRYANDDWLVVCLSKKSQDMVRNHKTTEVIEHLNSIDSFELNDDYFEFGKSDKVARIIEN